MPEKLYLTSVGKGRWAGTVRAVRDVRGLLLNQESPSIKEASAIVRAVSETGEPQLVATNDDLELIEAAAGMLEQVEAGWEVNPIIEEVERVLPEGDDSGHVHSDGTLMLSNEGIRAALVTLAAVNGSASNAVVLASTYERATGDPVWAEVRALIFSTFPREPHSEPPVVIVPRPPGESA